MPVASRPTGCPSPDVTSHSPAIRRAALSGYFLLMLVLGLSPALSAQQPVPFDATHWLLDGVIAGPDTLNGTACLRVDAGKLRLKDTGFVNGTIDFDMAVDHERSFPGMGFRMQDSANGEIYYLRPHQSGNPDAMQYFPSFHNSEGWQLYYGEGFNHAMVIPVKQWIHIHFVVKDSQAEIFWDQTKEPVLFISKLKQKAVPGYIYLTNGGNTPVWFAHFAYQKTNDVAIKSKTVAVPALPAGTVTQWEVSSPFDESTLNNRYELEAARQKNLAWETLEADEHGLADLARLSPYTPKHNTVFARMHLSAAIDTVRRLRFGFSDRARVYCNGRLLYAGQNNFRSRDYRFLGTIGLFDAVYLPLKKGDNELLIAVSEDFGGWGLEAEITRTE